MKAVRLLGLVIAMGLGIGMGALFMLSYLSPAVGIPMPPAACG
jgi:hypothetical protein